MAINSAHPLLKEYSGYKVGQDVIIEDDYGDVVVGKLIHLIDKRKNKKGCVLFHCEWKNKRDGEYSDDVCEIKDIRSVDDDKKAK